MSDYEISDQKRSELSIPVAEADRRRRRRWKRRMKVRAEKIKRQLSLENNFHKAMREIRTTTDHYRRSYLHWILQHMFTLFDYETGLHAINDKAAYKSWLSENKERGNYKS